MEETIDFSGATLDDFKFGTEAAGANAQEGTNDSVPAVAPSEPIQSEPVKTESPNVEPVKSEPISENKETAPDYKFKDDFIKQVVEFYEKTGDLTPYLQAKLVDFNSMSDEDVMRRNLREQYSDLSDKAFDRLYKQNIIDKYKLDTDEWGEDDSELGRELLKTEATKLREKYVEWQNGFKAPEPKASEEPNQEQAQALELMNKFEEEVRSNDLTKNLIEAKKLTIKTNDGEFNYEVPEAGTLLDMTIDNDKFFSQFTSDQGQLDYNKWYKTAAYSQNPELFERALINFGKTIGRSEITKEIKNPSTTSIGDVPTESSGDFTSGLLQAFASRGISK